MIRIRAQKDGFRRCGEVYGTRWKEYRDRFFTESQVEILRAEPMLQVEVIPESDAGSAPSSPSPAGRKKQNDTRA